MREIDFLPDEAQHSSAMQRRRLAGPRTDVKTDQTSQRELISEKEVSW